ncbi:MAG: hypothetical protein ONB44_04625 [candidate division KSB1 bacterium]|nr:hypothetical protein [candidate division KSB1 bacterium]MDZ7301407.1 hypothetical protein [candidate division KSB1 bacterium]MDZ7313441.1 hypothetical protein [candidate division KSB1 bacterium]
MSYLMDINLIGPTLWIVRLPNILWHNAGHGLATQGIISWPILVRQVNIYWPPLAIQQMDSKPEGWLGGHRKALQVHTGLTSMLGTNQPARRVEIYFRVPGLKGSGDQSAAGFREEYHTFRIYRAGLKYDGVCRLVAWAANSIKENNSMKKKFAFLLLTSSLLHLFACQDKIEPTRTLEREIPFATAKTLIFLSSFGLPGWQIMYKHENGQVFRLSTGPFDVDHDWSSDKQWIVYVRGVPSQQFLQIWKMKYNGNEKTALTPLGIDCQAPAFSPDGRQIIFSALTDIIQGERHLVIINANGTGWQQVTNHSTFSGFDRVSFITPTWFPDGNKVMIHFAGLKNATSILHLLGILDLVNRTFSPLPSISHLSPWMPNLSPTGKMIVFISGANGGGTDIFTINVDGTDLKQLTNDKSSWEPDWSPDEKEIVFSRINAETHANEVWVMKADGTDQQRLIPAPENSHVGRPRW